MRIPTPLCVAALAAVAFLTPSVRAQVQAFPVEPERQASGVILAEVKGEQFAVKGAVAINYSQPEWKASYNDELESGKFKNTSQRLGKNWWTSLDTTVALDIGGTKVMPGAYYLGIHVDAGGRFHLMVIDSKTAMAKGWAPNAGDAWKTDIQAPLTLAKNSLKDTVAKMEIEISANKDKPTNGRFAIRWGKHELSAPVTFQIPNVKDASADKDK